MTANLALLKMIAVMEQGLAAVKLLAADLQPPTEPAHYSLERVPPEAPSWRAVLEAGRRGELRVDRVGRRAVVAREDWDRYVASRRRGRSAPVAVEDSDARALEAMGVVLPMRANR